MKLHYEVNNGINVIEDEKEKVREYLEIVYPDFTDEMRTYDKWRKE